MALLSGGVRDGDLVRVDVAADGSQLVLAADAEQGDDVIEAELVEE
jgi:ATP-dependent Clp protease ATP-binding subunit ClpB